MKLNAILEKKALAREEAYDLLCALASGHYNDLQAASILTMFIMRGIQMDELLGFRSAMLDLCIPIHLDGQGMDVCGTGGDGKNTFNISTASSFVLAAAGQPVWKHGNYGVSSVCGSSDVLTQLGVNLYSEQAILKDTLSRSGVAFMHAPFFHPAMKNMAGVRKSLEVKTFFNMLGPLVNPSRPSMQITGVFSLELARLYHFILQQEGIRYAIIHSLDGHDEISLTAPCKVFTHKGEMLLFPEDFGQKCLCPSSLRGGKSASDSAQILTDMLGGNGTAAQVAVVSANVSLALFVAGKVSNLKEGVKLSNELLASGEAMKLLLQLKSTSHDYFA